MTFNLGGLAGGFSQGLDIGNRINSMVNEDAIAKVRAQGIAEARAMQAAGTPGVIDNGDMNNLTSNPQASADPAAAPVNTSLSASPAMQGVGQPAVSENGISTAPVAAPEATPSTALSSTPLSSADPAAAPAGGVTIKGGKRYTVGGVGFDDLTAAQTHAKSQAPDINDIMRKVLVPKMQEAYLAQGNTDKADAWSKWGESREGEQKMKLWGQAMTSAQGGNFKGAADALAKLHKDLDDGRTYLGQEDVKDDKGNLTGFNMKYRDDATGEEKSQFVDKHALIESGLAALSPQAMFEQSYKAQASADTLGLKAKLDAQNDARTTARQVAVAGVVTARDKELQKEKFAQEVTMEDKKAANKLEEEKFKSNLAAAAPKVRNEVAAKISVMREYGYSDDDVKAAIPTLIGIDNAYKKATTPEERRAITVNGLIAHDMKWTGYTDEQKAEAVAKTMKLMESPGATVANPVAAPASPAAAGVKPRAAAAPAKAGDAPLMKYDPATGGMVPVLRR